MSIPAKTRYRKVALFCISARPNSRSRSDRSSALKLLLVPPDCPLRIYKRLARFLSALRASIDVEGLSSLRSNIVPSLLLGPKGEGNS